MSLGLEIPVNIRLFHFDFFSSIAIKKSKHDVHKSGSKKNNGNFEPMSISKYPNILSCVQGLILEGDEAGN